MTKFDKNSQNKQVSAVKNTKTSISEKRKKKRNEVSLDGVHKTNLKEVNTSNKIGKNITGINTKIQNQKKQRGTRNKSDMKNIKRLDTQAKCPKNNKKISEVQINTNNKIKRKKKSKKQKQNINFHDVNKSTTNNIKDRKKQMAVKNLNLEHKKTKIKKLMKINEKKIKRISVEMKARKVKPDEVLKLDKHKISIKRLEEMLVDKSQPKPKMKQLTLRDRMMAQLRASRFRFINEMIYNNNSSESKHYFKTDPDAFMAYHAGYKQQLEQWPMNPLDVIISSIKKLPTDHIIADFGCGEARLASSVPHMVHSFDFIALDDKVKACDMAHTPLLMNSVHVVVFCLSLMGSNLSDYIIEANRVLKNNGILKIAEVESRFENIRSFIRLLRNYGFKNTWKDLSHNLFYFMDFKKEEDITMNRKNLPPITLKACLYKKR